MALWEGLWEGLLKTSENLWKPSENLWNKPLPLRDPLRGRFTSQNLSGQLPLTVLPLNLLRFLVFVERFPFFSMDFEGSPGKVKSSLLGGFPCILLRKGRILRSRYCITTVQLLRLFPKTHPSRDPLSLRPQCPSPGNKKTLEDAWAMFLQKSRHVLTTVDPQNDYATKLQRLYHWKWNYYLLYSEKKKVKSCKGKKEQRQSLHYSNSIPPPPQEYYAVTFPVIITENNSPKQKQWYVIILSPMVIQELEETWQNK